MARGNIKIKSQIDPALSKRWVVPSGVAGSIKAGEPTKAVDAAAASPYLGTAAIMVDGDGSTSQRFLGVAKSDSTDVVATAGEVYVWLPLPGLVYTCKAKTSTTADTQAEVDALSGKRVVFDLTTTAWTVDAAAADAVANSVIIIGGDYRTAELDFVYKYSGTVLGFAISA